MRVTNTDGAAPAAPQARAPRETVREANARLRAKIEDLEVEHQRWKASVRARYGELGRNALALGLAVHKLRHLFEGEPYARNAIEARLAAIAALKLPELGLDGFAHVGQLEAFVDEWGTAPTEPATPAGEESDG